MDSQQSPLGGRRQMPSSPLFTGGYEMQTDFTNDISRNNNTTLRAAP